MTMTESLVGTSLGLALVIVGPHVGEETDPCSASSATDVTDELARGSDFRAELCHSVLLSPTLFRCVVETGVFKTLYTGEADRSPL